ncbi:flagellar motor switch protein FliN [bacterium]|nr:flagellar motor switch protein FliN [bacterium]|tara:strand:- start:3647 stop:4108 length:462 start_codon:yes stop_codon:yes gene_type:complete
MEDETKNFNDPLSDVDPVMDDAFSVSDMGDGLEEGSDLVDQNLSEDSKKSVDVSGVEFPNVQQSFQGDVVETGLFANIPVDVSVELGRSTVSLKEIFEFSEGSIIELDRLVGEPLDLVVNGQVVAKGEVVAIDNNFGLRITSIVSEAASVATG